MVQNKTTATTASVDDYIASRANDQQTADCHALMVLLTQLTNQPATMWGPSIVGFGCYRYTYESGRSGEAPLAGFAIRGRDLVVYLDCQDNDPTLLAKLGKHKMSKSCLYFKQLADLDLVILQQLVAGSIESIRRRYGAVSG